MSYEPNRFNMLTYTDAFTSEKVSRMSVSDTGRYVEYTDYAVLKAAYIKLKDKWDWINNPDRMGQ